MEEGPVWIALRENMIVGTVAALDRGEDLYIRGMAVLPASRGAAIGERLLETVEHVAEANGHCRMVLSTTPYLDRAIRLYERYGFRRIDEGPHDLFGTPLFSMAKIVGSSERT
jgi:ribosomal protein S18 acetylase RimI-like enzyme